MRITLVSTWKIVNAVGGAERVFCMLANAMAERGHKVTGVCFDYEKGRPKFHLDERVSFVNAGEGQKPPLWLSKIAINIRSLSFARARRREKRLLLRERFIGKALVRAVVDSVPDVVVAFRAADAHILLEWGKLDVPVVTMSHQSMGAFLPQYAPESVKRSVEVSAAVQVLMPDFAQELKKDLPRARVVVIPNAVPQYADTADRACHSIINVAHIAYEKHQDLLVEAFALIADKYPDWNVKIFGGNDDQPRQIEALKKLINRKGLKDRILLCGTTDEVSKELKKASIFAFPSRQEGFGLALAEAMSMGLPAVGCRNCPAVNKIIRNEKNGFLCEDTPDAFAGALSRLMDDETLRCRLGDTAKEDMREYAAGNVWTQWEKLLHSVVKQKNTGKSEHINKGNDKDTNE